MKRNFLLVHKSLMVMGVLLFACLAATGAGAAQPTAKGYSLTVEVTGAKETTGVVRAALFNDPAAFPDGKFTQDVAVPLKGKTSVRLVFRNLPAGTYAISLYHDADNNDKFGKTLGLPKESYGFSVIHDEVMSKPKFDDAKFEVKKNISITIPLLGP